MSRKRPPPIPRNTCPDIDSGIKILEELRDANSILRENAEYYQEECDRLEGELSTARDELEVLQKEVA